MSNKEAEFEYDSSDVEYDDETDVPEITEVKQAPKKEVAVPVTAVEPPKKVKKPMKPDDKRTKGSSAENLKKARATRLANIKAAKEAAANQYEIASSESDEETEPVLTRQKKPVIVDANAAKMIELELKLEKANLMIEKLAIQHKAKKKPKVIQINPTPATVKEEHPATKNFVKKYLDI